MIHGAGCGIRTIGSAVNCACNRLYGRHGSGGHSGDPQDSGDSRSSGCSGSRCSGARCDRSGAVQLAHAAGFFQRIQQGVGALSGVGIIRLVGAGVCHILRPTLRGLGAGVGSGASDELVAAQIPVADGFAVQRANRFLYVVKDVVFHEHFRTHPGVDAAGVNIVVVVVIDVGMAEPEQGKPGVTVFKDVVVHGKGPVIVVTVGKAAEHGFPAVMQVVVGIGQMVAVLLAVQQTIVHILLAFVSVIYIIKLAVIHPHIAGAFNADGISLTGTLQHMVDFHILNDDVFTPYHPDADAVAFSPVCHADDGNVRQILHQQLILCGVVQGDGAIHINGQRHVVRLAFQRRQELIPGGNRHGSSASAASGACSVAYGLIRCHSLCGLYGAGCHRQACHRHQGGGQ